MPTHSGLPNPDIPRVPPAACFQSQVLCKLAGALSTHTAILSNLAGPQTLPTQIVMSATDLPDVIPSLVPSLAPVLPRGSCALGGEFPKFLCKAYSQPQFSCVQAGAVALPSMACLQSWALHVSVGTVPWPSPGPSSCKCKVGFSPGEFCGPVWRGPSPPLDLCGNWQVLHPGLLWHTPGTVRKAGPQGRRLW